MYAFTGRDADTIPAVAPVEDVILDLFASQADATADANILDSDTTDADGEVQFSFDRVDDTAPGGGQDQIVFVKVSTITAPAVPATMEVNGESLIEIGYDARSGTDMAPDSFDLLNTVLFLKADAFGVSGDELVAWGVELRDDTTMAALETKLTDVDGRADFTPALTTVAAVSLPTTFYVKLAAGGQQPTMGHAFTQESVSERGTVEGSYSSPSCTTGLTAAADTVDIGDNLVTFSDADVFVQVFQEADDTLNFTDFDVISGVALTEVDLSYVDAIGDTIDLGPFVPDVAGQVTFINVPTGLAPYVLSLRST